MKYFVTGITGFACPHLAKLLLKDGHTVHALIRGSNGREYDLLDILTPEEIETITWHYGDLTDYQSLLRIFKDNQFDGVFHLGAQSHPPTSFKDPVSTMRVNVMGTVNLIDVVQRYQDNCIFHFCSTSEVYGDMCKDIGILKEDLPLMPSNPYGTSKAMIDLYVQERCKNGYLKGFITRAFSHTGERRGKNFSISWDAYHLALMATGYKDDLILPVGNLETQRVVIDAYDCVNAYYLLMKKFHELDSKTSAIQEMGRKQKEEKNKMNGQAYNVCGDIYTVQKMGYFTDKLIDISGLKGVVKEIDKRVYRPIDIKIQVGDTNKLRDLTGWKPEISLEVTLEKLYNYWYKKLK